MEIIYTFGVMIVTAAVLALFAQRVKQPLLLGYVIAGLILGPAVTGLISDPMTLMAFFAEFGLILLLFVIGLELDLTKIKSLGKTSVIIGTLQVALITAAVLGLALLLGFDLITSLYAGLIVAFSSTLVVVKLLTDKKQLDTFHGQQILGIVLVEDILAVVGLTLLGVLVESGEEQHLLPSFNHLVEVAGIHLPEAAWFSIVSLLVNGILFIIVAYVVSKYVMPKVFQDASEDNELLSVAAIGIALVLGAVGGFFGFSFAIGAFVAGIVLSSAAYSHEIMGRVKPIKDFFLILFFVALGTLLTFGNLLGQLKTIALLLLAAVLLKPVIIFFIRKAFKYSNRTSFLISAALAQISEFSLILAMAGVAQGAIAVDFLTGAVIATLISMMATAYIIKYDEQLYMWMKPMLAPLEQVFGLRPEEQHHGHEKHKPEIIVLGMNTMSAEMIESLHGKKSLLLIEKDPRKVHIHKERGVHVLCTDAFNQDIYDELVDFERAETVISVVNDERTDLYFVRKVKELKKDASIVVTASTEDVGKKLYKAGATLVLQPDVMGRRLLCELLMQPEKVRSVGKEYYAELGKSFVYHRI